MITTNVELLPISVPNFILTSPKCPVAPCMLSEGSEMKFRVGDLNSNELDALAQQFRVDLFKKAGRNDVRPWRPNPPSTHDILRCWDIVEEVRDRTTSKNKALNALWGEVYTALAKATGKMPTVAELDAWRKTEKV